jgi:hypothetical protein
MRLQTTARFTASRHSGGPAPKIFKFAKNSQFVRLFFPNACSNIYIMFFEQAFYLRKEQLWPIYQRVQKLVNTLTLLLVGMKAAALSPCQSAGLTDAHSKLTRLLASRRQALLKTHQQEFCAM